MATEHMRAWAYLSRVAEPPCPSLATLIADEGVIAAAEQVRSGTAPADVLRHTTARREIDCAEDDLVTAQRLGGRLVTMDDDEWPLLSLVAFGGDQVRRRPHGYAPMALWVLGDLRLDDVTGRAAAIVGTRAASAYGEHVAADLAAGLVARDVAVVSGGAFGIDGAAHRATLACEGLTVAVLAGGVDVPYPAGHTALLGRVAKDGLVISEYPPGMRPTRVRFLTRNRLVAALSGATVVVEAGVRSGAANTAGWAAALGRPVCAVPGPVTSAVSMGCHALIRDGAAHLVGRAEEVVELVGRVGELAPAEERPVTPLDGLDDDERRVYEALPARAARTADEIAVAAGMPAYRVLGPLAMLEMAGLVMHREGRWQLSARR
ncbi:MULTISPECIES: DNA-processing protein DprA [Mycobacteriaceae]|uniref:DNA-processing protein DprA n=1 Tax=Mycobacteriaceae TaxID=1762 RepID=UPI0007FE52A7|nr:MULTISPECIES: DNA-processing protein DprA [Mycobacteriaceae]MCK0175093.1 DNA-processing protein DprA [Mycolicibacterium sp. F2034L]OBB61282.1 DNA protecting protein DprA [Mycobacterium sp. 852013-51886_SCH5428379]